MRQNGWKGLILTGPELKMPPDVVNVRAKDLKPGRRRLVLVGRFAARLFQNALHAPQKTGAGTETALLVTVKKGLASDLHGAAACLRPLRGMNVALVCIAQLRTQKGVEVGGQRTSGGRKLDQVAVSPDEDLHISSPCPARPRRQRQRQADRSSWPARACPRRSSGSASKAEGTARDPAEASSLPCVDR